MKVSEYATYDATGLAALVAKKKVSPKELAKTAAKAIEALNPDLKAVVELYPDRIEDLDPKSLADGPFKGVPFLMKDVFGHEKGRKIEFGSALCEGMIADADTYYTTQIRAAGINIIGRSAAPEYSMSGTTENRFYGNTSTPWKLGYSAGGSSGGAAAAVASGMVPIAHGSDIGGSIRIPASWCGGVGLKPSRGRVSVGPVVDEGGLGFSVNMVQTQTVRDAAAILDAVSNPQIGDPFVIPKPDKPYLKLLKKPQKYRIGLVHDEFFGVPTDPEVKATLKKTAKTLEKLGHDVDVVKVEFGGADFLTAMNDLFFFGFNLRLDAYGKKTGRKPGPKTLEPVIHMLYEWSKEITPARYFAALAAVNVARRKGSRIFATHDIMLTPTTARPSEAWGKYHLSREGVTMDTFFTTLFAEPIQFTMPHNMMGTPAISLPLAMHSTGVPIGIQLAGRPATEHVLLNVAAQLEEEMPWKKRVPPMHASRL